MSATEQSARGREPANLAGRLDEEGFLLDPQDWSREVAEAVAGDLGIPSLGPEHWQAIEALRGHHQASRALPPERLLCHELGLDDLCLRQLFGGRLEALQVAGLPNPGEEARTYLENEEP